MFLLSALFAFRPIPKPKPMVAVPTLLVQKKRKLLGKIILLILMHFYSMIHCQEPPKKVSMSDTLDGKLDFSSFIIDANGFLPIAMIITEPAFGGFGVGAGPLFIKRKKRPEGYKGSLPPDITAGFGMYTANNSWVVGGARLGSFPKIGIKYRIGGAYGKLNLNYYETIGDQERTFSFNIETLPIMLSVSKRIVDEIYFGVKYLYIKSILSPNFSEDVPEMFNSKELNNQTAALGAFLDWDKRNSIFTPDKGYRVVLDYSMNSYWTGSDYEYQNLSASLNWFLPIRHNWVSGLRLEGQHIFGDAPLYLLPSINMRGVPLVRYQGNTLALIETEQRFDIKPRWSILGFVGTGKTATKDQDFMDGSTKTVYSGGTGFRYLLARAFNVRTGIDVAYSGNGFTYYIVMGHNWNR